MPIKNKPKMTDVVKMRQQVKLESKENQHTLYIYGAIGDWWDETSADDVLYQVRRLTRGGTINVHIHSPGGNAVDGMAIYNTLKAYDGEIIVHIDGWAASAASAIAMAGDKIIMPKNTLMMIHNAWTFAAGTADELEKQAADLRTMNTAFCATYLDRFVGTEDELKILLDAETWLTADEAVALGLADDVSDAVEIPAIENEDEGDEDDEQVAMTADSIVARFVAQSADQSDDEPTPTEPTPAPKANTVLQNLLKL